MRYTPNVARPDLFDNFAYPIARDVLHKLPGPRKQFQRDPVRVCNRKRCIVSSLLCHPDREWPHQNKYGNKRFGKGRVAHS